MKLAAFFRQKGLWVEEGKPLSLFTTMKVGGPTDLIFYPRSLWELLWGLSLAEESGVPFLFLGGGSNLLVRDGGWRGLTVSLKEMKNFSYEGGFLEAEAGVSISKLLSFCLKQGLSGLEFLAGVPASVGGAVVMNAGAFGQSVADLLEDVTVWEGGNFKLYQARDLSFSYRSWGGPKGALVVKARFRLRPASRREIQTKIKEYLGRRRRSQPMGQASAGCVFKNPPEAPAGYLIEQVGLKGFVRGGAMVSQKHANFILNLGQASAEDVLSLMDLIKEKVFRSFGIELEEEVKVVGEA